MFRRIFNFVKKVFKTIVDAFKARPRVMIISVVVVATATAIFAPILSSSFPTFFMPITLSVKNIVYSFIAGIVSLYSMAIIVNGEASV